MTKLTDTPAEGLRICSLLPSSTEIVGRLSLHEHLVAVTHECDECPGIILTDKIEQGQIQRVTTSDINPFALSQGEIDAKVKESIRDGLSLYGLDEEKLRITKPTVVFTQALCNVCAPAHADVVETCQRLSDKFKSDLGMTQPVKVVNLEPNNVSEVGDTFVQVARDCGVTDRGVRLRSEFMGHFQLIQQTIAQHTPPSIIQPRVMLCEWLDPIFDGGHWINELIRSAGCVPVYNCEGGKSKQRSWEDVLAKDIDCVVVACCGFDVARNREDVRTMLNPANGSEAAVGFRKLYDKVNGNVFVVNGNRYFARPGPSLVQGAALIARCAYSAHRAVVDQIESLGLLPTVGQRMVHTEQGYVHVQPDQGARSADIDRQSWVKIDRDVSVAETSSKIPLREADRGTQSPLVGDRASEGNTEVLSGTGAFQEESYIDPDIEDYIRLHEEACAHNKRSYIDPLTGYHVFTRVAHEARGKCCGGGCRHCPFAHTNVKDMKKKMKVMMQPAYLHERVETVAREGRPKEDTTRTAPEDFGNLVLFWSGGKDSYLTLREIVRTQGSGVLDRLTLLTTFGAHTRTVAHQEIGIEVIHKQAEFLDISLVGVPLTGGGAVPYLEQLEKGLALIEARLAETGRVIDTLAFGDLHLQHIKQWRDSSLGARGVRLAYPLFCAEAGSNYKQLAEDLERSTTPCVVSACEGDFKGGSFPINVGDVYGESVRETSRALGWDEFAENGEFHTLAKVWEAQSQAHALGLC
ncbi:hypothetical protein SARC_10144 [Sphaeroforma arctica JP610]|uniref:Diphthine--ammonia ligase n=1 Tax=Sphaeroforma arctica JP610 TaxID=667725 RepID=A0A0L0FMX0_9EUKA|nr:hypothetical protein SARC_10144 [Sphaeroforma arctica JP610]KNC77393.1 hypothetical protein SARC_10144 [Sphaeroforma arctica JP610]|eukprot:XP_014151295.1 hypothetical protein SARC_10144 [Sphaeroforma arctica JP610]